jgi:flagellin FlaB
MGFATTQKAKTTIVSTLSEAGSSIEIEGKMIGSAYQPAAGPSSLNVTSIPIKIVGSGDSVNLDPSVTAVKYLSNQITYDDIYAGTLNTGANGPTYNKLEDAVFDAEAAPLQYISVDPYQNAGWPLQTTAFIYWTKQANTNDILEAGEHANLAIVFAAGDRPQELDTIRIELIPPTGAALTVTRTIPNITTEVVDLG